MTPRIQARLPLALLAALALAAILPGSAAAHAELVRAIPADGETVAVPVTVLSGRYSEDLTGNSNLRVLDAGGTTVATGGIDPENPRRMIVRPDPPLADGTYTVRSTATSADGHTERVTWTFTVLGIPTKPLPSPTPTGTAEVSASPTAAPTGTPAASPTTEPSASLAPSPTPTAAPAPGSSTAGVGDVLLPIVAALAIVAIGAGFLLRRGRGPGPTG